MMLLVHVHSHCGVLQPDDQAFISSEIASQLQNITSAQLTTVLQNQAAMIASQAEIIRALADVNQTLTQRCCGECTTTDIPANTSSGCFTDCLDYRTRGHNSTSGIITTLSQDGECSQESYCDMETDGGGWTVFQRHQSDAVNFTRGG